MPRISVNLGLGQNTVRIPGFATSSRFPDSISRRLVTVDEEKHARFKRVLNRLAVNACGQDPRGSEVVKKILEVVVGTQWR